MRQELLAPLQTESELQWDQDSIPNRPYNCGPSSVEKVANYYKDLKTFGINKTRMLGTDRVRTGTNTTEQKKMLNVRGIPSTVQRLGPAEIKSLLRTTRRPLVVWLVMKWIPQEIKGNTFDGNHAVAFLAKGTVNGESGVWVNEPNQHRERSTYQKNRFFPDKYWIKASAAIGKYCLVPDKDKVIKTRFAMKKRWAVTVQALTIRSGPSTATKKRGTMIKGQRFTSNLVETAGGKYLINGKTQDNWLGFVKDGKQFWVAKAYCREV